MKCDSFTVNERADCLLKHEMRMTGLDDFTTDEAKKACACCGIEM